MKISAKDFFGRLNMKPPMLQFEQNRINLLHPTFRQYGIKIKKFSKEITLDDSIKDKNIEKLLQLV
jgi:hypothetical protein